MQSPDSSAQRSRVLDYADEPSNDQLPRALRLTLYWLAAYPAIHFALLQLLHVWTWWSLGFRPVPVRDNPPTSAIPLALITVWGCMIGIPLFAVTVATTTGTLLIVEMTWRRRFALVALMLTWPGCVLLLRFGTPSVLEWFLD